MSINRVLLSGNLTRDPELKATAGGTQVLSFGLAVNDRRRNSQTGDWEDYPNFIDCVMFGARAEAVSRFIAKGAKVAIEGSFVIARGSATVSVAASSRLSLMRLNSSLEASRRAHLDRLPPLLHRLLQHQGRSKHLQLPQTMPMRIFRFKNVGGRRALVLKITT